MKDFAGKVAVVTGAGSGIGLGLALRFAQEGMNVVVSDINPATVEASAAAVEELGVASLAVVTDVSSRDAVRSLRDATFEQFGTAHIVCNNAGRGGGGRLSSDNVDIPGWRMTMDVDLFGIVAGIEAFLPRMLEQNEGHIVNTASRQGLVASGGGGAYCAAKMAAVAACESLHSELQGLQTAVGTSVLCPGGVRTGMLRPPEELPADIDPAHRALLAERYADAATTAEVADLVVRAIEMQRFYILTHAETIDWINERTERIAADMKVLGTPR
jgi:NAD(P)-dependent dehydrogenase (short-subunit alcohol dehydrogenase family)